MWSSKTSYATQPPSEVAGGAAPAGLQHAVGAAALLLASAVLFWLPGDGWRMRALLLLGMALGATLYLASFSFTSAYREFILRQGTAGLRAQILMVGLAAILFAPVLAAGYAFGLPAGGAVAPAGTQVLAGAFMFGLGMQLAGGCASGTLSAAGGGSVRMLVVLSFFCAGSFWASLHMSWWERLPSRGEVVLGDLIGWPEATALQLAILATLWIWLSLLAPERSARSSRQVRAFGIDGKLAVGGTLLAVLSFLVLLVSGHPWNITWAFALWGAKLALPFGWQPETSPFWNGDFQRTALDSSILADVTSVTNIGIMLGALAAAAAAGRFSFRPPFSVASISAAVIGGLAMGYGARIAYGCNIGAFFSGVASTSLHGWVWIVAALAGTAIGVRLRPWFGLKNSPRD